MEGDKVHRSLGDVLVLLVSGSFPLILVSAVTDGHMEAAAAVRSSSLLHGLLVLRVPPDLVGLLALLAPLALLVFMPPVAVALLAVVPPPAAAAAG